MKMLTVGRYTFQCGPRPMRSGPRVGERVDLLALLGDSDDARLAQLAGQLDRSRSGMPGSVARQRRPSTTT